MMIGIAWLGVLLGLLLLLAAGLAIFLLLQRMFRNRAPQGLGTCGKCGYSVEGLAGFTCPECGADLRTVGIIPGGKPPAMRSALLAVLITFGLLLTCCAGLWFIEAEPPGPAATRTTAVPPAPGPIPQPPASQPLPDVE